ncbi:hypothetical protein M405DRAFT_935094 [Rhizopogon salebrosus TDB-379]|nr:hypothetical protein M405DRAFT_935094 [Rhizopogon salebrosus TDB-379]
MNLSTQFESPSLAKDLRMTCLNVLVAFLALQSTGSNGLALATLTLTLYTIGLHIAATLGASRQLGLVIFTALHAIPAVGIFAVTSVELALTVKSPAVAISIIILCLLPAMVTIVYMTISGDLSPLSVEVPGPIDIPA